MAGKIKERNKRNIEKNMERTEKRRVHKGLLFLGLSIFLLTGCGKQTSAIPVEKEVKNTYFEVPGAEELQNTEKKKNPDSTLSVPTDIEKIDGDYFIVDCYHNRVIYSEDLYAPLTEWLVLTEEISMGHTIAGNDGVYLIDDTENNRVLVYQKQEGSFFPSQIIENVGNRPHYIKYEESTDSFYVLSSMSGELYEFKAGRDKKVWLKGIWQIPEIADTYCRSYTIAGNRIYFPASTGSIVEAAFPAFKTKKVYQVPESVAGLVQITPIEDRFLLTVSTDISGNQEYATILETDSLEALSRGSYTDLYETLEPDRESVGTPYGISYFDGHYYLVEHRHSHGVFQFDMVQGNPEKAEILY